MKNPFLISILIIFILFSCKPDKENTKEIIETSKVQTEKLFTLLTEKESGFYFINEVNSTNEVNVLTYENYFNGGGVAVGDINNDGLLDIFMTGNLFGGRLYLNKGNMQFEQISDKANVYSNGFTTDAAFVDVNGDGYQDIYLSKSLSLSGEQRKNVLLLNNKDNTFTNKAEEYGIADNGYSNQSVFLDYDNDGDLDLYVMNHRSDFENAQTIYDTKNDLGNIIPSHQFWDNNYADRLYRNNGNNSFSNVTATSGILNNDFSLSAVASDINNDGYVDLYVSNDFVSKDHAYINQGNGTFKDEIETMFSHIPKSAMGTDIADYNNDGFLDLINVDMTPESNYRQKQLKGASPYDKYHLALDFGFYHQISRNMLQLNNGDGTFSEIGQLAGVAYTDWSWSSLFADLDNDGYQDLFISNGHYKDITDLDYLKYKSVEVVDKAGGMSKVNSLDLINLMSSTKIQNYAYKNTKDLKFEEQSKNWGLDTKSHSNGTVYADLDLDGDLDLIINNFNQEAFLYRNNSRQMDKGNYLSVALSGGKGNTLGFGAKVSIETNSGKQIRECTPYRGFLSSVDPALHFGLGKEETINQIEITWPTGETQTLKNIKSNQRITVDIKNGIKNNSKIKKSNSKQFSIEKGNYNYTHKENPYIDFKQEPLLEHMLSNKGPILEKGDINNDGLMDVYIGGSANEAGQLLLQQFNGTFKMKNIPDFINDKNHEDGGCAFIDVNNDGNIDLYVSSGSNEFNIGEIYQDRLYINDGLGNLTRNRDLLPEIHSSTSAVVPIDFDNDGDLDLFVGGFAKKNEYPLGHQSWLLKNTNGQFTDASSLLPNNGELGIISDAAALSNNKLIVVGEWINISILKKNKNGIFEISKENGLNNTGGWWNCIETADFDNDGDLDFVVGNRGENSMYKATAEYPASIYWGDFDNNNDLDAIPTYYNFASKGHYPKHGLDQLFMQMKGVRRTFSDYASYSNASLEEIIPNRDNSKKVHMFKSVYVENLGNGKMKVSPLPVNAQFSYVQGILAKDLNADGSKDIILVGNNFGVDIEIGKSDASNGLVLINTKEGFKPQTVLESGFTTKGLDSRNILEIADSLILVSNNNGPLQFFEVK
ncbi:VCBS repeat-containing protein [Lacinutrix jangbogonensis]|uniref:VCBS repeat-containing protein n=1 Tax=Lacinutrix jangbogonensis TaxID=1469557 RepID=UPI00053D9717|nr:VCBS repeat-containing protein [Lacinutrix jangbogonensis]